MANSYSVNSIKCIVSLVMTAHFVLMTPLSIIQQK